MPQRAKFLFRSKGKDMINVSIVVYQTEEAKIRNLIAVLRASALIDRIFVVDNSSRAFSSALLDADYIFNNENLGYGRAHNIAIRQTLSEQTPYHLVLNPDVTFDATILQELIDYMEKHKDVASLMPQIYYPNGKRQHLCKLLPTPLDLLGRRFLPRWVMKKRNRRYELRDTGYKSIMNIPYLSGCFMLLRSDALREVGIFDERFFLYPEDIDLTRRLHACFRTVFYPHVSIVHEYGQGSYKSVRLLCWHMVNMCRYFCKWGWIKDPERKLMNQRCLKENMPSVK